MRLLADIAAQGQGSPVAIKDVAARQCISKLYLSQLTGALKNAHLLKSVWGKHGGFVLARPASDIHLRAVLEAVDGPLAIIECVENPDCCPRVDRCKCRSVWQDINQAILAVLEKYTVEDLREPQPAPPKKTGASRRKTGDSTKRQELRTETFHGRAGS